MIFTKKSPNTKKKKPRRKPGHKAIKWHKWLGIPICFFGLMFAISGIILNHREAFSSMDLNRKLLPSDLHLHNWNLGALRGTTKISKDSILIYGSTGIYLTDSMGANIKPYHNGIRKGADNQMISSIVQTHGGDVFAIGNYNLYQLSKGTGQWKDLTSQLPKFDRLMDITMGGDTMIVLSRSHALISLPPYRAFKQITLREANDCDHKLSLFRTVWLLHSGELFGHIGKTIVDLIGVVLAILCLTGIMITLFPPIMRRGKAIRRRLASPFKLSHQYHSWFGEVLLYPLIFIIITGTMLRPPLLLTIIFSRVAPVPFSTVDSPNPWHDKLRTIRYDQHYNDWILYSSEGFYTMTHLEGPPKSLKQTPVISVMGINVMTPQDSTTWLVGSFSGLAIWDRAKGENRDYFTGEIMKPQPPGPPGNTLAIGGFTADIGNTPTPFSYGRGAENKDFPAMPSVIEETSLSLWRTALEVHTGRIYRPFLSILSPLFIFLSGTAMFIVMITGHMIGRSRKKARNSQKDLHPKQEKKG